MNGDDVAVLKVEMAHIRDDISDLRGDTKELTKDLRAFHSATNERIRTNEFAIQEFASWRKEHVDTHNKIYSRIDKLESAPVPVAINGINMDKKFLAIIGGAISAIVVLAQILSFVIQNLIGLS